MWRVPGDEGHAANRVRGMDYRVAREGQQYRQSDGGGEAGYPSSRQCRQKGDEKEDRPLLQGDTHSGDQSADGDPGLQQTDAGDQEERSDNRIELTVESGDGDGHRA